MEIEGLFNSEVEAIGLKNLIIDLLGSLRMIGTNIRNGEYSSEKVGTQNAFGDHQLHVDLHTDEGGFILL